MLLRTPDVEHLGPGYSWAETAGGRPTFAGDGEGWDATLLQIWPPAGASAAEQQRLKRLGLATTLLGEGHFMYTQDQIGLHWQPEYEWDFGEALGPFRTETHRPRGGGGSADTLYVRHFQNGFVEVNPDSLAAPLGVPGVDARLVLWPRPLEFGVTPISPRAVEVRLQAPGAEQTSPPSSSYEYLLRYATTPVRETNWDAAVSFPGNPVEVSAGGDAVFRVNALQPQTTYYFALRSLVDGRLETGTFAQTSATTLSVGPPDPDVEVDGPGGGVLEIVTLTNPYRPGSPIRLRSQGDGAVEVEVINVRGERIQLLAFQPANGSREFDCRWDGRTEHGQRAGSGVYHLRARTGGVERERRFVLLQ